MLRRLSKAVFVVLFVLAFSSAALALPPEDALSARPAKSVYTVVRIDDMNGLLQYVFSPAHMAMISSMLPPDQAPIMELVAAFATQVPAKAVLISAGMATMEPFVQVAVAMPASARPKLDQIAKGSAGGADIITLLLGDAGLMFAGGLAPEVQRGAKGPYYSLMGTAAIAAKDDLLLIASSPAELEASLTALEKKENRLSFKRRFDSPNYWLLHMDMPTIAALAAMTGEKSMGTPEEMAKIFKAPLRIENGLTVKPDSVLWSVAANVLESVTDAARYKDVKAAKDGNMFLAGGGKLLCALAGPLAFKVSDLKAYPEAAEVWEQVAQALAMLNISEAELEDLLNGSYTIAFGSDAKLMDANIPGGYIALTGRKGAAGKMFAKFIEVALAQGAPIAPLKVDGWDSLYTEAQGLSPVPVVFGVMKDTLFVGVINTDAMGRKPELPAEAAKMFGSPLFGSGFFDFAGIWSRLRKEAGDPNSMLSALSNAQTKAIMNQVFGADLSVPLVKMWSPELETAFIEFSTVNVPQEKRLLPVLLKLGQMMAQ